jgi:hypothetical protein
MGTREPNPDITTIGGEDMRTWKNERKQRMAKLAMVARTTKTPDIHWMYEDMKLSDLVGTASDSRFDI